MPQFVVPIAIALVLAVASYLITQALTPKPKKRVFQQPGELGGVSQIQKAIVSRELVYGEVRKSGAIAHAESTADNKYLHMVIILAHGEIDAVLGFFINDYLIYLDQVDGDNVVSSGKYANKVRVSIHLGTAAQTADADLVAESAIWTTDHKLSGIAYMYIRMEFDRQIFPSGIPSISALIRGRKCTEIRDSGQPSQFTFNPALITRDYLTTVTTELGLGFTTAEIDDTYLTATANTCDELVEVNDIARTALAVDVTNDAVSINITQTLDFQTGDQVDVTSSGTVPGGLGTGLYVVFYKPIVTEDNPNPSIRFASSYDNAVAGTYVTITSAGSGTITVTKHFEPRYTCSGVIDSARTPHDNLGDIMTSMSGRSSYVGGVWKIRPGVYESPTIAFDESDIIEPISVQTKHSRRDRFNAVKGIYTSPTELGVEVEYPPVTNSTYEAEDNGQRLYTDLDLPFTTRPHTAMRLAKLALERHRQSITFVGTFKLSALQVQAGDVIQLSNSRMGWTNKEFEVVEWEFLSKGEDAPIFVVRMGLQETASGVFDWARGEETTVDLAPNTFLPNPFSVGAPTGFSVSTESFLTNNNTQIDRILLQWNTNIDFYVRSRGRVEIQFRKTNDTTNLTDGTYAWLPTGDSGLSEYYMVLNDSTLGNPNFAEPFQLVFNTVTATLGTVGSLAATEWGYGDIDSLGFETIYVRLTDDSDPDDSANTVEAKIFEPSFFVDGSEVRAYIAPVRPDTSYDIRVRNLNYLGVRSTFNTILSYIVGSAGEGATGSNDYGLVTGPVVSIYDRGGVAESTTETFDYGEL
jgi:hypothetical protein